MIALLAVCFESDANLTLATNALRRPSLSVVVVDQTRLDLLAVLESPDKMEMAEAVRVLTLRPGISHVEMYPT